MYMLFLQAIGSKTEDHHAKEDARKSGGHCQSAGFQELALPQEWDLLQDGYEPSFVVNTTMHWGGDSSMSIRLLASHPRNAPVGCDPTDVGEVAGQGARVSLASDHIHFPSFRILCLHHFFSIRCRGSRPQGRPQNIVVPAWLMEPLDFLCRMSSPVRNTYFENMPRFFNVTLLETIDGLGKTRVRVRWLSLPRTERE